MNIIGLFRIAIGIPLWIVALPFIAVTLVLCAIASVFVKFDELEW